MVLGRRAVAFSLVTMLVVVGLSGCASPGGPLSELPNILVITADDMRFDDALGLPNLNALRNESAWFENAFVATSRCCPSRATFLTGEYSHNTGIWENPGAYDRMTGVPTIADWLHDAGYETAFFGKYFNRYEAQPKPSGWDEWEAVVQAGYYTYTVNKGKAKEILQPDDLSTRHFFRSAGEFLERGHEKPWFVWLAPLAPHSTSESYPGSCLGVPTLPTGLTDEDDTATLLNESVKQDLDRFAEERTCALRVLDKEIGLLERSWANATRPTAVIFTSDNGILLGEHNLFGKNVAYEPAIHVPLLVKVPGRTIGSSHSELVSNVDLAPTIAAIAGISLPSQDGRNLVEVIEGPSEWRDGLLLEHMEAGEVSFGIRTHTHKLVLHGRSGECELFDLVTDLSEANDLCGNQDVAAIELKLRNKLAQLAPSPGST